MVRKIPYFKKGRNLFSFFLQILKREILLLDSKEFLVMTVLYKCYIGETKRAITLRLREHQANCRKKHSAVVDQSAMSFMGVHSSNSSKHK